MAVAFPRVGSARLYPALAGNFFTALLTHHPPRRCILECRADSFYCRRIAIRKRGDFYLRPSFAFCYFYLHWRAFCLESYMGAGQQDLPCCSLMCRHFSAATI